MSVYDKIATAALLSGAYDDGLTTFYQIDPDATPTHLAHNGIGRTGVQYNAGASGIGTPVRSVWLRFKKYGLPTGPITVNIRNSSDTIVATIGTFNIEHFPAGVEQQLTLRNRFNNSHDMASGDRVSVEFPSNTTNGFEITTHSTAGNLSNYTSQSHNGTTWSSTSDPACLIIKG
jgi:hypothetical protein